MARGRGQTVVTVEGGRELRRRLRTIEGGLGKLKEEHRWIADYIRGRSAPDTPRRTGRLASTVRSSGTNTASTVRAGTARVPYAGPIHYGWPDRHISPQTWVVDAALMTEPIWVGHYNNTIRDLVENTPGA